MSTYVYPCLLMSTNNYLSLPVYIYLRIYTQALSACCLAIHLIWRNWHETNFDQLRWQCHRVFLYHLFEAQSRDLCCFCGVAFCKELSGMQCVLTGPCYGQSYIEGQHREQSNGSFALTDTNFSWGWGNVCLFIYALEHSSWKRMQSSTQ